MQIQRYIPLLFILLFIFFSSDAQNSGNFKKGMKAFNNAEYGKAENYFKDAYSRSNDRGEKNEISFKMAQCYFYLGNYKKAESNFRRTLKMRYDNPMVHYYLAECYKGMEKFDKAKEQYDTYIKLKPDCPKGLLALESLHISQEWISEGSKYRVVNAGNDLNSKWDDFSPAFLPKKNEKLFFTSAREGVIGKGVNHRTGQFFADIFSISKPNPKNKKKRKSTIVKVASPEWDADASSYEGKDQEEYQLTNINGGLRDYVNVKNSEEGVVSFNGRGSKMFFTSAPFVKNQWRSRRIYSIAYKRNKGFTEPAVMEVIPIDTLADVHGPSISSDEKTLFFSSEMEGGFGGTDIYVTHYDRRTKSWGEPQNLGENINSSGNEGFAHYNSSTKNLYFSSDGRLGMGGLDIYKAVHNPNSDGSAESLFFEAENLRYPINTTYDDFGIAFEPQGIDTEPELKGYISSNRVGKKWRSKGNVDIYYFDKQQIFFDLEGYVVDSEDGSPLGGVKVELIGPSGSKIANTDGNGKFAFDHSNFAENEDYRLTINKDWYFQIVDKDITTKNIEKKDCKYIDDAESDLQGHLEYNFYRGPVEMVTMRRPLVLKSVLFDLGKSDLRESSRQELDSLASLLNNDWPDVVVELRSHTDLRGSDTLNQRLSNDRALSCVNYLVEQGVDAQRLVHRGMASSEPVKLDDTDDGLPIGVLNEDYISKLQSKKLKEKAHQKNRRTDFKVLSNDFKQWIKENPNTGDDKQMKPVKDAAINDKGEVVPIKKTTGNFLQQTN